MPLQQSQSQSKSKPDQSGIAPPNVEVLLKRFERMKTDRQLWEPLWQEIADYIHPTQNQFVVKTTPGAKQTEKIFDSTALDAHDRLASVLNGTLTSRVTAWFGLKMRNEKYDANTEVQTWLEDCALKMFREFNRSNFAQEIHETYLDESAFGTASLFLEEKSGEQKGFKGFLFRSLGLYSIWIEEDHEGRVNTVFREFELTAGAALAKWGRELLGEKVLKAINDQKPDTKFKFLHVTMPRAGVSLTPVVGKVPSTRLPWASYYIGVADKNMIMEGGFYEFPFMVPRWTKNSLEKYGRGPGHMALPDVKTLNKVKQLGLKTWAKTLDMPTKSIDDGVTGDIRNYPGGNTIVSRMDAIEPLYPPGMFRESISNDQIKTQDLQGAIKRYFYADQMELPSGPAMTAFEVAKRFELLQRLLGPTMGRQETELLNPLIDRAFGMMQRGGAFVDPPAILTQDNATMDVVYEGPLAKSQRLAEVEGIERFQQLLMSAAQVDPGVIDILDYDIALRIAADVLAVPAKAIRDPKDVLKMRAQRQAQQAQQQKLSDATQMATAAGKAAPALKAMPGGGANAPWAGIPSGGSSGPNAA